MPRIKEMRPIVSVWSAYGHTFLSEDGHESCLTCGAVYELRRTPDMPWDGEYQALNGDEPVSCMGVGTEHGDPRETGHSLDCADGCENCQHDCNCLLCS